MTAWHRGSVRVSHPAITGSNPLTAAEKPKKRKKTEVKKAAKALNWLSIFQVVEPKQIFPQVWSQEQLKSITSSESFKLGKKCRLEKSNVTR